MSTYTDHTRHLLSLPVALVTAFAIFGGLPGAGLVSASTQRPSYLVVDNNGANSATSSSSCATSKTCANGLRLTWTAGTCYDADRYPPVAIVWTSNQTVAPNTWPLVVGCGTGIQFSWDKNNQVTKAKWIGSGVQAKTGGLAICFQYAHECGHSICVTNGCIPAHTNGLDVFFQGGDSLQAAQWLSNGKVIGSVTLAGSANDVFWYGHALPVSAFANNASATHHVTSPPAVSILGRNASWHASHTTNAAPPNANGVDFTWFLPLDQTGPNRGCFTAAGTTWAAEPVAFAYTSGGALASRVTIPMCPTDSNGNLMPFNDINFSWGPSADGTGYQLNTATPAYDRSSAMGCQPARAKHHLGGALHQSKTLFTHTNDAFPAGTITQPPAGTDGILFAFHHDDFKSSCWADNGRVLSPPLSAPGHPRLGALSG